MTERKYHHGRITEQMTVTVLGLYCKEDKVGLFFLVNLKSKLEFWSYINKFVAKDTTKVCTDSAKHYVGIEKLFVDSIVHLATIHSVKSMSAKQI